MSGLTQQAQAMSDQPSAMVTPIWRHQLPTKPGGGLLALAFVDILMLMLAFLVIGSGYMVTSGVYIDPPSNVEGVSGVVPKLVISLNADGDLYFNDRYVADFDALETQLSEIGARESSQAPVILLRADKNAAYPDVVRIVNAVLKYRMRVFLWTEGEAT